MTILKNAKLRKKMIYAFAAIILVMAIAQAGSMFGLSKNKDQITQMRNISMTSNIASTIEAELLTGQNVFKEFTNTGDTLLIDTFDNHLNNMSQELTNLKTIETNEERIIMIRNLETKIFDYKNGFSSYYRLDERRLDYYADLSEKGGIVVSALEYIDELSRDKDNTNAQIITGKASSYLLQARLQAMKFFTFHTEPEYNSFLINYAKFTKEVSYLKYLSNDLDYRSDYRELETTVELYKSGMEELKDIIGASDYQVVLMDQTEISIRECVDNINNSILEEEKRLEDKVKQQTVLITLMTGIVAILAIVTTFFISSWLLKIVLIPIESLRKTFIGISEGEVDLQFRLNDSSTDEIGQMSKAFNLFMVNLKSIIDNVNHQNWLKTAQNELNSVTREDTEIKVMPDNILNYLCSYLNAERGVLYINEEEVLVPYGTFATANTPQSYKIGENLVGQTAKDKTNKHLKDVPEDYYKIKTGLGETLPSEIIVIPCVYENEVKAVIELSSLNTFSESDIELLTTLSDAIAIAIHSTVVQKKMKILLEKTLNQSEELQMQQEELRQSNEELEEQTRALKESEQKLQAQQEELRVSNEELEQRAKQLEFQKKALDDTNKEILTKQQEVIEKAEALELANAYKSEFLANMSHELRTPLNSILVLSQLLSERESSKPLSQKEKEFAETIYSSGSDLLMLINDVLDLSKVEAGHLDIHLENFKLSRLIKDSISMFKPMTDVKAIEFHTYLDKSLPEEIKSDYLRIQQIIKNLVSNSIKFTENGNVSLTVRKPTPFEADTIACDTENYIAIDVSDTGIGIPEDKKQIIFEAFRQSDGTTSRKYGGTGLGLTISRELSSMLKGSILVESTMGKGSKFVFILPTNINQPLTNTVTSMKQQDITNEIPKIAKIDLVIEEFEEVSDENLLLIIEDDKTFSNILVDLSVEKGFSCIAAYTGAEGINLARSRKPSAVVLDLGLPDMDGMEVVKQLGKLNIPIHIISGTDQNANLPNSVIGYLKKPVDIKTIYKTLATIESLSKNTEKKLLIIGPCNGEDFEQFSSLGHMSVEKVITFDEGHDKIKSSDYDCLVIDYGLKDENGHSLIGDYLDDIKDTPTILYSEHELSSETLNELHEYTDSIILKSSKSEERLIDEVTLFLHGMKNAMNQTVHTTNQYKTVILDELSDKIKREDSFEGKKVLIVDDDERNVYALSNVLFKHGFEVAVAHDGLESIRKVQSDTYDLVLMDIMMPKMDGYDAIKGIRNIHAAKHIPIIALTAKAMKEDRIKCIEAGANDYLTKPIDIEKLLSMMKVWLA